MNIKTYVEKLKNGDLDTSDLRGFRVGPSCRDDYTACTEIAEGVGVDDVIDALQGAAEEAAFDEELYVCELLAIGEADTEDAIRILQALLSNDRSHVMEALWDGFDEDACEAIADRLIGDDGAVDPEVAKAMNAAIEAVQKALTSAWSDMRRTGREIEITADDKETDR